MLQPLIEDFLILPLDSADVILRVQWLSMLGFMSINWKNLTVKFKLGRVW